MYKLVKPLPMKTESSMVLRIEDNASIPFDNDNVDYQKYLEWVNQGNQPEPADE